MTDFPGIVAQHRVTDGDRDLTVSTVRVAANYYDTVVFDNHEDHRHSGMILPGHEWEGLQYGPYVIDKSNERADDREAAMGNHREALYAARTETLKAATNA